MIIIGAVKPITILVVFCNVLIFMFMQVLLFWYVISKAVENIIIDKSSVIRDIIRNSTVIQLRLNNYIQSEEYQTIYNQSIIDQIDRTNFNIALTWRWMIIPFLIVIIILIVGLIYTFYVQKCTRYNNLKLDQTDLLILATVFLSFLTEIIFIFVLVMRYVYISDMEMIIFFMNSKIGAYLFQQTQLPTFAPL